MHVLLCEDDDLIASGIIGGYAPDAVKAAWLPRIAGGEALVQTLGRLPPVAPPVGSANRAAAPPSPR